VLIKCVDPVVSQSLRDFNKTCPIIARVRNYHCMNGNMLILLYKWITAFGRLSDVLVEYSRHLKHLQHEE
jgi:hypothetical protein